MKRVRLPQVTRDLLAAGAVLAERGLSKRAAVDFKGRVCAAGAMSVATAAADPVSPRYPRAFHIFENAIDDNSVVCWNDAPWRTQAEVEDAFEAAASLSLYRRDIRSLP